jgi:hypothetical protein
MKRALNVAETSLPFSHTVAVELEGCNRIFSIHDSLSRLKHMIEMAHHRWGN